MTPDIYDPLTGLPGLTLFAAQLDRAYRRQAQNGRGLAVLALAPHDLGRLRQLYGWAAVDAGIAMMGQLVRTSLRTTDSVSHQGDGHFLAAATSLRQTEEAVQLARRVHDRLHWAFSIAGQAVRVPISMGLALRIPCTAGLAPTVLLQEALEALREAQFSTRGAVCIVGAEAFSVATPPAVEAAVKPVSQPRRRYTDAPEASEPA